MDRVKITNTELETASLSLGTVGFGTARSREEAFEQMDLYTDEGGNFLDTALVYGDWACDEAGCSERVIGEWMARKKNRSEIILSTKGCHPPIDDMNVSRVRGRLIHEDVEKSLRNLRTDYIDLYFLHRDDESVCVGELLEALEEEVRKGNIRYYGCSNWSTGRIRQAAEYAAAHGLQGFSCNQVMFSLADIDPETLSATRMMALDEEGYQDHRETGMALMAYMCQAGGYFYKRLAGRPLSEGARRQYDCPSNDRILEKLEKLTREGWDVNDFIYAFVRQVPFPAIPIAAFGSRSQLEQGLKSADRKVPDVLLRELAECKQRQIYR